jgi:dTDP-4-dehydrorhamnose 3,5-epimerase-like enzyme
MAIIEQFKHVPFDIKRAYYLFNVPDGVTRGGHAHKNLYQLIIAVSGSFNLKLNDGVNTRCIHLYKQTEGMIIVPGIWRELIEFSGSSVCLVLASELYDENDYIRDFETFLKYKQGDNR